MIYIYIYFKLFSQEKKKVLYVLRSLIVIKWYAITIITS